MIKSIINISDVSCINIVDSEIDLLPIQNINYFETELGSGGFGNVFKIQSINGIQTSKYVLKIISNPEVKDHAYDTIAILHSKIKKALINTEGVVVNNYPELLGLPFLVCKAYYEIEEKEIIALIIHNLDVNNYRDFGADNFDKSKYIQTEIPERIYYAFQLVKTIRFLNKINFLHSDISENSIWINNKTGKIALIDYDSGYHTDSQKKPTTIGKIGQWTSVLVRKIIAKEISSDQLTIKDRIDIENWDISNAIFELIFGVSPYFFLLDTKEQTKYIKKYTWPKINLEDNIFNKTNLKAYQSILQFYNLLNENGFEKLINAFDTVFNSGLKNPSKRLTVSEWYEILFEIGESLELLPNILDFKADKKTINSSDDEVNFSWKHSKGNKTYINTIIVKGLNHKSTFNDTTNVELKVTNEFGESTKIIAIQANKVEPKIRFFKSDILERIDLTPVILSWETSNTKKVRISDVNDDLVAYGTHEIDPRENKKIKLTAVGNFNEEVNAEIEITVCSPEIVKFKYEINIEKGIDNIDLFWQTENTTEVSISPRIGNIPLKGQTEISLTEKTDFTITAKGFFNEVSKTIETQPFPVPIIKGILIPTPILNIEMVIPASNLQIPHIVNNNLSINFNNSISFKEVIPDFTKLKNHIDKIKPIENKEISSISPTSLFNNLFKKITNK